VATEVLVEQVGRMVIIIIIIIIIIVAKIKVTLSHKNVAGALYTSRCRK